MTADQEMTHCSFDNQTCYKAKTVPVIHTISSHTGYVTGGQNLTVKGHGFTSGNITATVDGVNCEVTQYHESSFSCELQPASAASATNVSTVGQHGLRRRFYNASSGLSLSSYSSHSYTESLNLNFEVPYGQGNYLANRMFGWFIAPATT